MVKGITSKKRGCIMETNVKRNMIRKAKRLYTKIFPCGRKESLEECFTITGDTLLLWFNTKDQNTHVVIADKDKNINLRNYARGV